MAPCGCLCLLTNQDAAFVFCTEFPHFCIEFTKDCISLSQSDSRNFWMYIISRLILKKYTQYTPFIFSFLFHFTALKVKSLNQRMSDFTWAENRYRVYQTVSSTRLGLMIQLFRFCLTLSNITRNILQPQIPLELSTTSDF